MHYILIIALYGGYLTSSPSLTSIEYNNQKSCEIAAQQVKNKLPKGATNSVSVICTQQGYN